MPQDVSDPRQCKIPGVVLAGGMSSRMGQDKARIRLGGMSLLDRAVRRLSPQVSTVSINANGPILIDHADSMPVFADAGPSRVGPLGGGCTATAPPHAVEHASASASRPHISGC